MHEYINIVITINVHTKVFFIEERESESPQQGFLLQIKCKNNTYTNTT